ncbi:3' terminal RNA ribose 2'-O-methyltransferase Hen1 [Frankia gtarii]|uniref:3' terminal RNA ribose 2'-O-methyltransferase Hen1 n=1 Tax=Frankia gtarii TaxID=2950102 RepID=UPI0021C0CE39|nr:3' terminal RNA ribose 2'-O-methyltransferase Hen1 [Frankia gtarii]
MLLTIATTHPPARDLGFLLHKHPDRVHAFTEPMGTAHVFYPEATGERCTVALLLEVDPVALVRGRKGPVGEGFALTQYVNDRPYAASSMLAMALKDVFRTAMTGRCDARPELAAAAIPLEIHVPAVASRAGADLPRRLFEPLGWRVAVATGPLDPDIPDWGESPYLDVRLAGELRLADALNHLYVLLPVLDDAKHYRVGGDEVDKLLRAGADWLPTHPESELIARRYLSHRRELTRSALARLAEVDDTEAEQLDNALGGAVALDAADRPLSLAEQRRGAVLAVLRSQAARRVGDLGCGEGLLARDLLAERTIEHVLAADVSARALRIAGRRLRVAELTDSQRARLTLIQSSLTYRDERLTGLDAAVLMEVVEHVDPARLGALEATVFGYAAPGMVIVTTPNVEYNVRFSTLPAGAMRHRDHRFEWSRAQLRAWADRVAAEHGYTVRHLPVGPDDPDVGPPTQLAVFNRTVAA